jgi:hypothetical protein
MVDIPEPVLGIIIGTYLIIGGWIFAGIISLKLVGTRIQRRSNDMLIGVLLGIFGGIVGNYLVSMNIRLIEGNNDILTQITFIIGLIGIFIFLVILFILVKESIRNEQN